MPPSSSSFGQITNSLSLEKTSLAIPFLRLPSRFHRKANGIYIYKMGTEDEVSIYMPKPPRDGEDFFELAMAVSKHKLFHGHFVFVAHDIRTDMAKHTADDRAMLENISEALYKAEVKYREAITVIEKSYQRKAKDLYHKFVATVDTDEAIKTFRIAHEALGDRKERLIAELKVKRDLEVYRFYQTIEHVLNHSEVNKANYTKEEWCRKSAQEFMEKFADFGLHNKNLINERRTMALEKILQQKTDRFVENLLIDAAIAGHKTAHQHIKLEDLNCQDGIKLKMVKKLKTIDEMKMLLWDLQKYGASSTYYWLENPLQVNDLIQGLTRRIEAYESRCVAEEMLKASQRELSEVDLSKLVIHDDEEINEEIAKIPPSQHGVRTTRAETADEVSRAAVISPDESLNRPRSMF